MKKILLLFFCFIIIGILLSTTHVLADKDGYNYKSEKQNSDDTNKNSNIFPNSEKSENKSHDNEREDDFRKEIKIEKFENDKENETRIRVKEKENETEIESELKIETVTEDNETKLKVELSNGTKREIKILPSEAAEKAREILNSSNLTIKLEEINHKNIPRVVYNILTNKHGRFLGIFKIALKEEAQIDTETGEVLQVSKPWWAFLVAEEINLQKPPINNTSNETITTNNTATLPENTTNNSIQTNTTINTNITANISV